MSVFQHQLCVHWCVRVCSRWLNLPVINIVSPTTQSCLAAASNSQAHRVRAPVRSSITGVREHTHSGVKQAPTSSTDTTEITPGEQQNKDLVASKECLLPSNLLHKNFCHVLKGLHLTMRTDLDLNFLNGGQGCSVTTRNTNTNIYLDHRKPLCG